MNIFTCCLLTHTTPYFLIFTLFVFAIRTAKFLFCMFGIISPFLLCFLIVSLYKLFRIKTRCVKLCGQDFSQPTLSHKLYS